MAVYPVCISKRDELHSNRAIRHVYEEIQVEGKQVTRVHTAWKLELGVIVVHELTSNSNPSSNIIFFENLNQYLEFCEQLDWINSVEVNMNAHRGIR